MNKSVISLVIFALFSISLQAHESRTDSVPAIACEAALAGSQETLYRQYFSNWEQNYEDGLLTRGYMGNAIPNTPLSNEIALEYGIMWWGMTIRIVPDLQAAKAHRQRVHEYHVNKKTLFTDTIVESLYILGDEKELGIEFDKEGAGKFRKPVPAEKVRELLSRGGYQITAAGEVSFYSPEHLARRTSIQGFDYGNVAHLSSTGNMNSISQGGWVTFKQHGLHDYSKWKTTDSAKRLKKLAQRLVGEGWTIRFNHDHEAAINMLVTQERTYVEDGVRHTHDAHMNRYKSDPNLYKTMLERLMKGDKGYSIGIYTPAGVLAGGEIGTRHGNHVLGDSVFYDRAYTKAEHGFDGVDLARIAALALMEIFEAAGQPYTDPGMITAYTASMGAEMVPFAEFRRKIKSGPSEMIRFPATWDPRPAGHFEAAMEGLKRRRNQAILPSRVIARMPVATPENIAVAASLGVKRANMKIVLVPSLEDAKADAAQITKPDDLPLYLIGSFTNRIVDSQSAPVALEWALRDATQAVWFKNGRFTEHVQPVDLAKLREMIGDTDSDGPQWTTGSGWPQFTLGAWAL